MLPPQALHYVGLALARAAGWAVARLTVSALDRVDPEIFRLSKLDERTLLKEIAIRDTESAPLQGLADGVQRGQAIVDRWLPKARALICPHREVILNSVDAPEVEVISTVVGYLWLGLPGALVKPVAAVLVKRGLPALCGASPLPGSSQATV